MLSSFCYFNDTATTELYTLSLHDALPISDDRLDRMVNVWNAYQCMVTFNLSRSASYFESGIGRGMGFRDSNQDLLRSEEHTSELQSRQYLVCRLLLEKKK